MRDVSILNIVTYSQVQSDKPMTHKWTLFIYTLFQKFLEYSNDSFVDVCHGTQQTNRDVQVRRWMKMARHGLHSTRLQFNQLRWTICLTTSKLSLFYEWEAYFSVVHQRKNPSDFKINSFVDLITIHTIIFILLPHSTNNLSFTLSD